MKSILLVSALVVGVLFTSTETSHATKPLVYSEHLTRMILQEANNEPLEAQVAVASVALNRLEDPRWPATERGVVRQPHQFTGMMKPLRDDYTETQILSARVAAWLARKGVAPCGKKVYWYHHQRIEKPAWTKGKKVACRMGVHIFYRERG